MWGQNIVIVFRVSELTISNVLDLLENSKEDFNSSDKNEEILDIETPFDMSEDILNIE